MKTSLRFPLLLAFIGLTAARLPASDWSAHTTTAPDDTTLDYLVRLPVGEGPFPIVIFFHAAPGGVGLDGLKRLANPPRWTPFLKAGIAVCMADYRGHTANRPFEVLRGDVNATDDVAAIFKALSANPELDLTRAAILANSLGGAISLQTISDGKVSPRCLVLNAPASFFFLGLRGRPGGMNPLTDADIDKASALQRIAPLNLPMLLIQGTADPLYRVNEKLAEVMIAAGKDVRFETLADQNHSFTNGPDSPAFQSAVALSVDFVRQHLASSSPSDPTAP
jgi:dipeptidyl aminopeptidase/acylaminoacyl peptidase